MLYVQLNMQQNKISPICCFLGHVDVGKTSLLDSLRKSNIQKNEAGCITQQIGATFFNRESLNDITDGLSKSLEIPGLLIIDTPGHDCFTQMRLIGIKVSHLPILVVDIMKGLEKQTKQCIELLVKNDKQFVIALNKLDKLAGWKITGSHSLKIAFAAQDKGVMRSLKDYSNKIICQVAEIGLNAALYYENNDTKNTISMVPISGKTCEGIGDLMILISKLTTKNLIKAQVKENFLYNQAFGYIIELKQDEKHSLVNYALLVANSLKKGDRLLVESINGSVIEGTIKEILVPPDQKEMKNKINLKSIHEISGTCGLAIKFSTEICDDIAPGGIFMKVNDEESITSRIKHQMEKEIKKYQHTHSDDEFKYENTGIIVNVPAKGMGYAILKLLHDPISHSKTPKIKIQDINVGKINKTLLIKASIRLPSGNIGTDKQKVDYIYNKRYTVILDYNNLYEDDVKYDDEINELAEKLDIKIIHGNIIHHLIEKYHKYINELDNMIRDKYPNLLVNCQLQILPKYIFLKKQPIMFGVKVVSGTLKTNIILKACKGQDELKLGNVTSIQKKNKPVTTATKNDEVCIRIEDENGKYEYGKHFNEDYDLAPYLDPEEYRIKEMYGEIFE